MASVSTRPRMSRRTCFFTASMTAFADGKSTTTSITCCTRSASLQVALPPQGPVGSDIDGGLTTPHGSRPSQRRNNAAVGPSNRLATIPAQPGRCATPSNTLLNAVASAGYCVSFPGDVWKKRKTKQQTVEPSPDKSTRQATLQQWAHAVRLHGEV